jgi:Uma2 family endonuclease
MTKLARIVAPAQVQGDHIVLLHGISWKQFAGLLHSKGESSVPRFAYHRGELELMSPSTNHEEIKKKLARLLEAYADDLGMDFEGYGSWTLKRRKEEAAIEPDECYVIGGKKDRPDLALEVIWTSGSLNKLDIYRALQVREVWFWKNNEILIFVLKRGRYVAQKTSALLPALDLDLVRRCLAIEGQSKAVRAFRAALRK